MGRAVRFLPYVGYVTIIMTDYPFIKYALIGALGLLAITSKGSLLTIYRLSWSCVFSAKLPYQVGDIEVCIFPRSSFPMANFAAKYSIMTQEMVDSFCDSFYIPAEVHPTAPGGDKTITQFPVGKVGGVLEKDSAPHLTARQEQTVKLLESHKAPTNGKFSKTVVQTKNQFPNKLKVQNKSMFMYDIVIMRGTT
ncbi:signal peptidase complex catalytic subunit SEC11C-like protein [Tanacetum coccineum]